MFISALNMGIGTAWVVISFARKKSGRIVTDILHHVICSSKYQGLVKWYHATFGALWRKFDSFIPDHVL